LTYLYTLSLHDALPIFEHYHQSTLSPPFTRSDHRPASGLPYEGNEALCIDRTDLIESKPVGRGDLLGSFALGRSGVLWQSRKGLDRKSTRLNSSHRTIS